MQKVAAYLLERRDGVGSLEARTLEARRLIEEVLKWLKSKGASDVGLAGTYVPEDGSTGSFSLTEAADADRVAWILELQEDTVAGRRFSAAVSITSIADKVSAYITLETGWTK